jgi:non-canonical poly(A) RNA polymerase PAPD5/7
LTDVYSSHCVNPAHSLGTGSLNVDIGINNSDGVRGVETINDYLTKMPALRPLILVVKGFLAQRHLNDASKAGLGSYGLILMCISFLQAISFLFLAD